jgi:hypothetical protein
MCMNGLGVQQAASVGILLARASLEVTPATLIISLRAESAGTILQCLVDN